VPASDILLRTYYIHPYVLYDAEPELLACMCCFFWVDRRRTLSVTPLPMQNLLWFARTLSWCEKVCDSRVLQRLVRTVAEPGNVFASLLDHTELQGLQCITQQMREAQAQTRLQSKTQGREALLCQARPREALARAKRRLYLSATRSSGRLAALRSVNRRIYCSA